MRQDETSYFVKIIKNEQEMSVGTPEYEVHKGEEAYGLVV